MAEKNIPTENFVNSSSSVTVPADININDKIVGIYKSAQDRWIDDLTDASNTLGINKYTEILSKLLRFLLWVLTAFWGGFFAIVIEEFLSEENFPSKPAFYSLISLIASIIVDHLKSKLQIDYKAAKKDIDRTLKDMKSQQKQEI